MSNPQQNHHCFPTQSQNPESHTPGMASSTSRATLLKPSSKLDKFLKKFIIFLLAIIIITITISFTNKNEYHGQSKLDANSENSLKIFCSETQEPELCFTSISTHFTPNNNTALKEPDPDEFFSASLQVAIHNISSLTPLAKEVLAGSTRIGADSALDHCNWGFNKSLSHLNRVLSGSQNSGGFSYEGLTSEEREDLVTWLIKGMSGLETCVDVLDEIGSAAVNDLSVKVYKARVQFKNSVDFLIYKDAILEKIHSAHRT